MSRGGLRLPLAAQVLILTLTAIVVAQLVTVLAVMVAPVARPQRYTIDQIAGALHGEAVGKGTRRPLKLRRQAQLGDTLVSRNDPVLAAELAKALHAPVNDVRFVLRGPPPLVQATSEMGRGMAGGPRGPPPRSGGRPAASDVWRYERIARIGVVEFTAARRLPEGGWAVVRPAPEWEWVRRVAIWLLGALAVMGPAAWLFARHITRPIRHFARAADRLGRDPAAPHVPVSGPAEIGLAAQAFNSMQARLQRYVSDRVSMMGAISHDLRTPLTRIRFKVETAEPAVRDAVLADVEQMETMVAAVLAFIRDADHPAARERIDLTSLVACAVDDRPEAGEAELDEEAPSLLVDGDPVALRRLLDNLIDNAVRYGERAHVTVRRIDGHALVEIADEGPGLAAADLEQVFTPFFRTGEARERSQDGLGLGLAIARSVARAHGGDVVLRPRPRGLCAEITLPLAETSPG